MKIQLFRRYPKILQAELAQKYSRAKRKSKPHISWEQFNTATWTAHAGLSGRRNKKREYSNQRKQ